MSKIIFAILLLLLATPSWATTYYFSTSGDDFYSATQAQNYLTPWKTVAKMNSCQSTLGAGDSILLKEGEVWNTAAEFGSATQLTIQATGSGGVEFIVGAYDSSNGARLARTDFTEWEGTHTRPTISGDRDGLGGVDPGAFVYPGGSIWGALVQIGTQYSLKTDIRLENIIVDHSTAYGIRGDDAKVTIHNCRAAYILSNGISLNYAGSNNSVIEYCHVYMMIGANRHGWNPFGNPDNWNFAAITTSYVLGATIQYNYIEKNEGEGIGPYLSSHNALIQYNKIFDSSVIGIYPCSSNGVTVRYNLIYGSDDTSWNGCAFCGSGGIDIGVESLPSQTSAYIYGNLVAGMRGTGIALKNQAQDGATVSGVEIYNNTVVDCDSQFGAYEWGGQILGATVKNNVFIKIDSSGPITETSDTPTVTADYNFWTSSPEARYVGAHDVINTSPLLTKTSGWLALTAAENGSSFAPQIVSPLIDAVAGITSYTTLPLSGSTWPASVTTGDATLKIKPNAPTLTCATAPNPLSTTPTFVASAFAATSATPVDFGAIQLNMSGSQTHGFWQVCSDINCNTPISTTPTSNADDAVNLTQLTLTAALNPGVTYYWRVRYKDNAYSAYPAATCAFYAQPGQSPTGSGGAVLLGAGTGSMTITGSGSGKGSATLTGPP